jgi:acetoin utilization deacetylase AcuC-like enzyme
MGTLNIFYSDEYCSGSQGFDTYQKAKWIAKQIARKKHIQIVKPNALTAVSTVSSFCEKRYIDAVADGIPLTLAESSGLSWDSSLFGRAMAHCSGMIKACFYALRFGVAGTLSSGFHHARYNRGKGFCTFNGLALATLHLDSRGIVNGTWAKDMYIPAAADVRRKSIVILDVDAHCGGGTYSMIAHMPYVRILDLSTSQYDRYIPEDPHVLRIVKKSERYLETLFELLQKIPDNTGLCIYNAGMDPHEDCHEGGLRGITRAILQERERMVFSAFRSRNIPVAFTIAGGYTGPKLTQSQLVDLHMLTINTALEYM